MEFQLRPNQKRLAAADTTDFSRVEIKFLPKVHSSNKWPKLNLHATEVGGIRNAVVIPFEEVETEPPRG